MDARLGLSKDHPKVPKAAKIRAVDYGLAVDASISALLPATTLALAAAAKKQAQDKGLDPARIYSSERVGYQQSRQEMCRCHGGAGQEQAQEGAFGEEGVEEVSG